jgi:drug/metabolite transporter (DMT)-like permease
MPLAALALLLGSALLHTLWNLLLKRSSERLIAMWWALLLASTLLLSALAWTGLPARGAWGLLGLAVLAEAAYYLVLAAAYREADFSLVYPIGRGAAPALIFLWSILFLGERPSWGGGAGVAVLVLGLLLVGWRGQGHGLVRPHRRGLVLALLVALIVSVYSVLSGTAVKRTPAFPYAVAMFFLTPLVLAPHMLRRFGWRRLREELAARMSQLLGLGLLIILAYLLALMAYARAPVGYTGAVREVSVVLAAFAGWRFLGEDLGARRVVGAGVIFAGILLIALRG